MQALLVERKVHRSKAQLHAQLFQVAHPRRHGAHAAVVAVHVFQHQRLAGRVAQHAVLYAPAGVMQQLLGTAQVGTQGRWRRVGARRLGHRTKGGRGQVLAPRVHQRQFLLRRQAVRFAGGVAKQAVHALVRAIEHLSVHPLEINSQAEGFAHAHVLQQRAAGVEHIALKTRRQLVLELALDQFAGVELLAVHAPRPVAGAKKTHQVEFARLQCFQLGSVVSVDLDDDAVKVGRAPAHVQVARPITWVTHIGNVLAKTHRANFVRAAAQRLVHHHLVKRLGLAALHAPVAAEHRQAADGQRQFAVGLVEAVAHGAVVQHINPGHVDQHRLVGRRGERADQRVKAVFDVLRQHRFAMVKPRLGPQPEGGREAIGRHLHILGQQAIAGGGFVQRSGQQGVEHQWRQVGRRAALDGERVVFVKGGRARIAHQTQLAAFGCAGIDIVEMGKIGRVLERAPQRIAMRGTGRNHSTPQHTEKQPKTHATILPYPAVLPGQMPRQTGFAGRPGACHPPAQPFQESHPWDFLPAKSC